MSTAYSSNNHLKHTYRNPLFQHALTLFKRELRSLVREAHPGTVLDAGCGEGFILEDLAGEFPDVRFCGIDLAAAAIRYARQHCSHPISLAVGDLLGLPFASGTFDLLICSEVLEHVRDVEPVVQELSRVARHYVLVSVPLEPYFQAMARIVTRLGLAPDPGHVQFWSRRSFQDLMCRNFPDVTFRYTTLYQIALARLAAPTRSRIE